MKRVTNACRLCDHAHASTPTMYEYIRITVDLLEQK